MSEPSLGSADADDTDDDFLRIGRRIFELRQAHRYSLRELARMSGLSASFLSEVERGRGEPSISALKRIASALEVELLHFFSTAKSAESQMITRAGTGRRLPAMKGVEFRLLVSHPDSRLESIHGRYEPGGQTGDEPMVHNAKPGAVEWGMILSGRFKVCVFILNPGDAIYFSSVQPHRIQNIDDGPGEYVWVNSPPSF
jgi:transcriptional regulator with XRE-family HTH domain